MSFMPTSLNQCDVECSEICKKPTVVGICIWKELVDKWGIDMTDYKRCWW